MALRFYSRLPTGALPHRQPELNRIALMLPVASLVIGIEPAFLLIVLTLVGLPGIFAAGIAVAVLLGITGAMAEDGLADAADGLFGGSTPTRRLEIMRDHTHGTYGVLALVLFLLLRVVAIGAVAASHPFGAAGMWLAAMLLARSAALWLVVVLPPARTDGMSAAVGGVTRTTFVISAVFAIVLGAVLAAPIAGIAGLLVALLLIVAVISAWVFVCKTLVGGQTGDLIGALQALLELSALAVFLAFA
jgi:adenosylcobinamide-GDP ribazoletransferase